METPTKVKMYREETYNGWTNKDTWAFHLQLTNVEVLEKIYRRAESILDLELLWELVFEGEEGVPNPKNINWQEILDAAQ